MRTRWLPIAACAGILACWQAAPALADPVADCAQVRNLDLRVRGCTAVIGAAASTTDQKAAAFRHRGLARAAAGARDQAISDLSEAIRLNGNDAIAYTGRAHVRLARGDTAGALADFSAALGLSPQSVNALTGRGHAYILNCLPDLAIADLTEAIRLSPKSASAYNHRGVAWRRKGDLPKSIDDYTQAITLNPIYALAYNNRGYVHETMGRKAEAIADFQRALMLDRSLVGASDGLKRLKAVGTLPQDTDRLVGEGKALVEKSCATCHATGPAGTSPNPKAPAFRELAERHSVYALREPLTRSIAAPHDEMPKFMLPDEDVDKIVANINNLTRRSGR
jgi:tetratricopeptide (TPR) repeat protein